MEIKPKMADNTTPKVVRRLALEDIWDSRLLAGGTAPGLGERPAWAWPPIWTVRAPICPCSFCM